MAPAETRCVTVTVLSVSSHPDDHLALNHVLSGQESPYCQDCRFEVTAADSVDGALQALDEAMIPIVLCERQLGKDSWRTLLARLAQREEPPFLIVGARGADEFLWDEALNVGAYDVLAKPFEASEVVRTLSLAWLRWNEAKRPRRAGAA